jgi:hypothetical protein
MFCSEGMNLPATCSRVCSETIDLPATCSNLYTKGRDLPATCSDLYTKGRDLPSAGDAMEQVVFYLGLPVFSNNLRGLQVYQNCIS